jgi:PhoH-like ATPase
MQKQYILDTSVLIFDPNTFNSFPNSEVIIPIAVLNELDKLKKYPSDAGKNARVAIRLIDEISNKGDISIGVLLEDDILLKVDTTYIDLKNPMYLGLGDPSYGDTQILACAISYWSEHPDHDVTLVSNDINLRIKARARGLEAEAHDDRIGSTEDMYSGVQFVHNDDAAAELLQVGALDPRCFNLQLNLNECIVFQDEEGNDLAMGRKVSVNKVKQLQKKYPWNLSARNIEQHFAIDLIMDPNVDLVTLIGIAGTGKSLVTLASCLELVLSKRQYDKLIIYRPIQPVGNDIGFLPGTEAEKLAPWFQATIDNFEVLFSNKSGGDWKRDLEMYQKKEKIEMEAFTYIRGRSIPNAIIFCDEVQNISKQDIKTILTRAGDNTKIILCGDLEQIDNVALNAIDNGLTYVIDKFKNCELAGHITFVQGERSRLATAAAEIL